MTRGAIALILALVASHLATAQDFSGTFIGNATPVQGRTVRIVLTLSKGRQGKLNCMMHVGSATDFGYECASAEVSGLKLNLSMRGYNATAGIGQGLFPGTVLFTGALSADENMLVGWLQGQRLELARTGKLHKARNAPENPVAPVAAVAEAKAEGAVPVATSESSALLARGLEKLAGTGHRLLQYTCIETIDRSYYNEPAKQAGSDVMTKAPANSCAGVAIGKDPHLTLEAEDRLRLAVAVADGKEIHSWAGASGFDSRSVYELVPNGPKSTGAFGTVLVDIFENPGARYSFIGSSSEGPRSLFGYTFEVPLRFSHYFVRAGNEWRNTAYHGSFQLDGVTADLARVRIETAELAPDTQMCQLRTVTDFHYAPIGNGQFLLPSRSELSTVSPNAGETHSLTTFSGCHEYTAESSVVFGGEERSAAVKAAPKSTRILPAGLSVTLALMAPIDTGTAAAGDAVSARVAKAVRAPGSDEILIAAGAVVHGRILNMQRIYGSPQFQYSIHYDSLEQEGALLPVAMRLERELSPEQRSRTRLGSRGTEFSLPPQSPAGETGSWFSVAALNGAPVVPEGFESKWVTVGR